MNLGHQQQLGRWVLWAATAALVTGCSTKRVVPEGLTGFDVTVSYDTALQLDRLELSGTLPDGSEAFAPGSLPDPPTALTSGSESAVLLLPEGLAGTAILLRVDGRQGATVVASEARRVTVIAGDIVQVPLTLGAPATCGDSVVRANLESCDDGNTADGDGCNALCQVEGGFSCGGEPSSCSSGCGDGNVQSPEGCDDGNGASGDGCDRACQPEPDWICVGSPSTCQRCGNGVMEGSEQCDDGNTNPSDGCSATCAGEPGWVCTGQPSVCAQTAGCGNGLIEPGEACDDFNSSPGDGCGSDCQVEVDWTCDGMSPTTCENCGNGMLEGTETCDDQNTISIDGCDACQVVVPWSCMGEPSVCVLCGDNNVEGGETCDDGDLIDSGNGCDAMCQRNDTCGDSSVQGLFETCDDGDMTDTGNGCSADCQRNDSCGDGMVQDLYETCDDQDMDPNDGCDECQVVPPYTCSGMPSMCVLCGDGDTDGSETCDDGDAIDTGNGCSATCQRNDVCGNSTVESLFEDCDDGDQVNDGNGCSALCQRVGTCGDSLEQSYFEDCDDGNMSDDGNGCTADCQQNNTCGDGTIESYFEECDDMNMMATDGCSDTCIVEVGFECLMEPSMCRFDTCGNNVIDDPREVCDGTDLGGATCLNNGRLNTASNAACAFSCAALDLSSCGSDINSVSNLRSAISIAFSDPGQQTIALQPGTFDLDLAGGTIFIDEAGGDCGGTPPGSTDGLVIQPLSSGAVIEFTTPGNPGANLPDASNFAFVACTPNIVIQDLEFLTSYAIWFQVGADDSVIRGNYFNNSSAPTAFDLVVVSSDDTVIMGNKMVVGSGGTAAGLGYWLYDGVNNRLSMNTMNGEFTFGAIYAWSTPGSGVTSIDHNTILMAGGTSIGVTFDGPDEICYRNNIIANSGIGYQLFSNASFSAGCTTANNVNTGTCVDDESGMNAACNILCTGGDPLCDIATTPTFANNDLCLEAGNGLIDAGDPLGYNMLNATFSGNSFNDAGPEVGARESGGTLPYANVNSVCP